MTVRACLSLLLIVLLMFLPGAVSSQVDPGYGHVQILGVFDSAGVRLGMIVVAGLSDRGFEAGHEYWSFSEEALLDLAELESLKLSHLAVGEWDDPWIVEALNEFPGAPAVTWTHPAEVEWTAQEEMLPPELAGGIYFGNATLGGLTIQYSERGPASLTWFKLTDGAFMQLEDGAVFEREEDVPTDGSWWHGRIADTSRFGGHLPKTPECAERNAAVETHAPTFHSQGE